MKKFILLASASLALAACSSNGEDAAPAEGAESKEAAAATDAAGAATAELAAMPTDALSGEAAATAMHDRHEWFEEL
ncbi:MAG: hypothetical protein KDD98_12165, partial [Sphingomonadaceae bacterium]|nr:hypothetical protein [Sphingomonadaceae bacterium]